MTMSDAEKALREAEKVFAAAEKKAATAREKYLELNAERNQAARALNHARTNPALYDDDPMAVVPVVGAAVQPSTALAEIAQTIAASEPQIAAIAAATHTPLDSPVQRPAPVISITGLEPAQVTAAAPTPPAPTDDADEGYYDPAIELDEDQDADDPAVAATVGEVPPWAQQQSAPAPVEAPKPKRHRRTKAELEAARAAEAAARANPPATSSQPSIPPLPPMPQVPPMPGFDPQGYPTGPASAPITSLGNPF